jgi:hypothetical protein
MFLSVRAGFATLATLALLSAPLARAGEISLTGSGAPSAGDVILFDGENAITPAGFTSNNRVEAANWTRGGDYSVIGGLKTGNGEANNNEIRLDHSDIGHYVLGGIVEDDGHADDNRITITGSTVDGGVVGGDVDGAGPGNSAAAISSPLTRARSSARRMASSAAMCCPGLPTTTRFTSRHQGFPMR